MSCKFWEEIDFQEEKDSKESIHWLINNPNKYIATCSITVKSKNKNFESRYSCISKKINSIKELIKGYDFELSACICSDYNWRILEHITDLENLDKIITTCKHLGDTYGYLHINLIIAKKTMDIVAANKFLSEIDFEYVFTGTPTEEYINSRKLFEKDENEYHIISGLLYGIKLCDILYFIESSYDVEKLHVQQFDNGYDMCMKCINEKM